MERLDVPFDWAMERRLAAILEADLVGYSRLMGSDEAGTHSRLKRLSEEFLTPLVTGHQGRVIKTAGDGYLCEFGSVVDAVHCALEWHDGVRERQVTEPDDLRFRFRIGINVGDVIVDGEELFGDGVNIAVRLEALADTDSTFISSDAYRQVRGKVDATFDDLGEHRLKNIHEPVHVYRVRRSASVAEDHNGAPSTAPPVPIKPSIAVLPFVNRSDDPEQEYFSDGVSEDIITALARIRWFFVIARNSSFAYKNSTLGAKEIAAALGVRYVLEGSVRRAGGKLRVTAELIDGASGRQLWARRYDRESADLFEVQDDITGTIVGAIEPELGRAERERARSTKHADLGAWDLYLRGMSHLYHVTKADLAEAKQLFEKAVDIDPRLAPAHSAMAEADYYEVVYGLAESNEANRDHGLECARRAVKIDPEDAGAHCTLGRIHYLRREHDQAILELETALELNPSIALAHYGIGAALVFSGKASESFSHLDAAIRLSPHDPNMGSFLVRMADAHYLLEDYEEAIRWANKALAQPGFQWSRYAVLLASLGQLGHTDHAAALLEELLASRPGFSVRFVRETHLFADPDDFDHYLTGLQRAGVAD